MILNEVIGLAILKTGTRMSQGPSLVYDRGLNFQIHDNCPILVISSEKKGGGRAGGKCSVGEMYDAHLHPLKILQKE